MNLKYLLFSTVLFVSFLSCGKDEDEEQPKANTSEIVGLWELTSVSCTDGVTITDFDGIVLNQTFTLTGKDYDATLALSENPNIYKSEGSYTAVSQITINGSTISQVIPLQDFTVNGTWRLDGNKLFVSTPGEPEQSVEILKLDANNLEYKLLVNEEVIESGAKLTTKATYIFKLKR